jgi:hypothetical protein
MAYQTVNGKPGMVRLQSRLAMLFRVQRSDHIETPSPVSRALGPDDRHLMSAFLSGVGDGAL